MALYRTRTFKDGGAIEDKKKDGDGLSAENNKQDTDDKNRKKGTIVNMQLVSDNFLRHGDRFLNDIGIHGVNRNSIMDRVAYIIHKGGSENTPLR